MKLPFLDIFMFECNPMNKGLDTVSDFPNLTIIHQKIPGREVGQHHHAEHELFIPLQGEIKVYGDGFEASAGPGKMLYVPPILEHRFSSSAHGAGERVILLIKDRLWKKLGGTQKGPTSLPAHSLIRELVFYLLLNPHNMGAKTFIEALTQTLIEQLNESAGISDDWSAATLESRTQDLRIKKAIAGLMKIGDQPSMNVLAKQSGLSARNLTRLFMTEVGMTPKQFAVFVRISEAKRLLKSTRLTITDISLEVGYQSLSKFIGAFQKNTGVLPSEFRKL